jgi:hypothetical protein
MKRIDWKGLTAKEIATISNDEFRLQTVERILKERNTYTDQEALASTSYPPQRTWVGLTDEEILAVNMSTVTKLIDEPIVCDTDHSIIQLGKAIEAKLKDKNT